MIQFLGVIFLTDEDDCSVKLGGRQYLDPSRNELWYF